MTSFGRREPGQNGGGGRGGRGAAPADANSGLVTWLSAALSPADASSRSSSSSGGGSSREVPDQLYGTPTLINSAVRRRISTVNFDSHLSV